MLSTRVVHPSGYRPRVLVACYACAIGAPKRLPGTTLQRLDPARLNQSYRCELRLDGCQHPDGLARR